MKVITLKETSFTTSRHSNEQALHLFKISKFETSLYPKEMKRLRQLARQSPGNVDDKFLKRKC